MKKLMLLTIILAFTLPVALFAQCRSCNDSDAKKARVTKTERKVMAGYNKANWVDANYYFTYSFVKKPKLGTSILKVNVYDKDKKAYNGFKVYADSDMPSMRGAHNTGNMELKPNKKGDLLIPINFVMPGVWEVQLTFMKDGKQVYCGCFELKI